MDGRLIEFSVSGAARYRVAANGYPHNLSEVTRVYFSLLVQDISASRL